MYHAISHEVTHACSIEISSFTLSIEKWAPSFVVNRLGITGVKCKILGPLCQTFNQLGFKSVSELNNSIKHR